MRMKTFRYHNCFKFPGELIWGGVLLGLVIMIVVSGAMIEKLDSQDRTQRVPSELQEVKIIDEWAQVGTEASAGDATVKILKVEIGPVQYESFDGIQFQSTDEYLKVKVSIHNSSKVKKYNYLSLGLYDTTGDLLEDEYGNDYPVYSTGTVGVVGQVNYVSLYPEQRVEDLLIFARPVGSARKLRLRLPGINITGGKTLRFQFPTPHHGPIEFPDF